jgi:hypothetical protein
MSFLNPGPSAATALLIKRGLRSGQPTAMHRRMQPALPRLRQEALELLRG